MSEDQVERILSPEEAKERAEMAAQFQAVRKHLKSQSKNELIKTVLQLMGAVMEVNRINKFLNDTLKERSKEPTSEEVTTDPNPAA